MRFVKWQALGNDYVIVEADQLPWELTANRVRRLCEPHFGIGSDGVLLLSRSDDPAHVAELRIFNPDGSEAELSGNGARQAALYLRRSGWTDRDEFAILTPAGEVRPSIIGPDRATLALGRASLSSADFPAGGAVVRGASSPITVRLDGGDLEVEVSDGLEVRLTGSAMPVSAGELSLEF